MLEELVTHDGGDRNVTAFTTAGGIKVLTRALTTPEAISVRLPKLALAAMCGLVGASALAGFGEKPEGMAQIRAKEQMSKELAAHSHVLDCVLDLLNRMNAEVRSARNATAIATKGKTHTATPSSKEESTRRTSTSIGAAAVYDETTMRINYDPSPRYLGMLSLELLARLGEPPCDPSLMAALAEYGAIKGLMETLVGPDGVTSHASGTRKGSTGGAAPGGKGSPRKSHAKPLPSAPAKPAGFESYRAIDALHGLARHDGFLKQGHHVFDIASDKVRRRKVGNVDPEQNNADGVVALYLQLVTLLLHPTDVPPVSAEEKARRAREAGGVGGGAAQIKADEALAMSNAAPTQLQRGLTSLLLMAMDGATAANNSLAFATKMMDTSSSPAGQRDGSPEAGGAKAGLKGWMAKGKRRGSITSGSGGGAPAAAAAAADDVAKRLIQKPIWLVARRDLRGQAQKLTTQVAAVGAAADAADAATSR